ncbi:MAG: carboxypeptidase-like regulatory domain-containing protein [Nonlabens sp.]|uniref:carboxypeptidase-like regulatory domain-containing protein n=1 Tax=Nonlabens sp. TaxID=1888209 RepID=UPI003EF2B743
MNKQISKLVLLVLLVCGSIASAQVVKGRVIDESTEEPIKGALIEILGTKFTATTDADGFFNFNSGIPQGEQKLQVSAADHFNRNMPIVVDIAVPVNIDPLYLRADYSNQDQTAGMISLTENDLSDDQNAANNVSGLLQSSRDIFLRAAAYDFSATFFRPRGLNSEDGRVLINGLTMNKIFSGRPQWSNWGGINDLQRNQNFTMGLAAADNSFGGLGGVQSIDMRASQQREGTRISYASANRSYTGRFMATYSSGLKNNGWAYSVTASRRAGEEGFIDGTVYDANSIGLSVEKKINEKHFLNFTGMYTPNRRGRQSPLTEEIHSLRGNTYNANWGYFEGEKRNSRIREIDEPILMLNHNWEISDKMRLSTNVGYQFGFTGNTRIDNGGTRLVTLDGQDSYIGGARNPNPDYYQNLPSYFLRNGDTPYDLSQAYLAQQEFINDGQLDWNSLYRANASFTQLGGTSVYAIQEDRIDDDLLMASSILTADITDNILFTGGVSYRNLKSENYARIADLLGGGGYLDVDFFAQETANITQDEAAQSDLNNPNRIAGEGDRYKYNYDILVDEVDAFAQAQFKTKKVDFYVAGNVTQTSYQRDGKFRNGNFANNSFGKGEKLDFTNFGIKGGATYKLSGKSFIDVNGAYLTDAPTIRSAFPNARQNNNTTTGLESSTVYSTDLSYIFRTPFIKARLTGYFTQFKNGTDVGFYFVEGLSGAPTQDGNAFVQEVMTNIDRRNVGGEVGIEVQATPTISLKAAAAFGTNTYSNNPNLYLNSDDFPNVDLTFGDGTTKLKDYHVAGGPERAYQVGFEYRDPEYWFVGATANFFANSYVDVSALRRTENFVTDLDGLPIANYDEDIARDLLRQKQFNPYELVNIVGGKSWRIGDKYVGFFATINNVLGKEYRTGGFEQGRLANYQDVLDDSNNPTEVFAPRYFYGNSRTYYLNVYLRF